MDNPGLLTVVIAAEEIIFRIPGKNGNGRRMAFPPAHIDSGIVHSGIDSLADWPMYELDLGVLGSPFGTGREDNLIIGIGMNRDIGEVKHGIS